AVVPSYPRHPTALAQQAATVNALTGGRLVLGVGPSHKPGIEDRLGLKYDRPALHMREYVSIIKPLAEVGEVNFQGEMYEVHTNFKIPDARPFPVVISALAPRMLKSAGEVADGTVTWMVGRKTIAENTSPRIREAAQKAGRGDPRIIVGLPVCVHDDAEEARQRAIQIFKGYGLLPNYRRQLEAEGFGEAGEIAVVGNETAVKAQLEAFFDAGATEVIASVFPAGQDGAASFRRTQDFLATLATTDREEQEDGDDDPDD
ncbi:MAG: TIGR03564 family F420-dependent LLM class oxidoreductase, partial [Pseudomonadales bacterium]|nr:TIGR03564 family F420-dependent LLM class oxidoreductase [Pseudomonadales bacterium]